MGSSDSGIHINENVHFLLCADVKLDCRHTSELMIILYVSDKNWHIIKNTNISIIIDSLTSSTFTNED